MGSYEQLLSDCCLGLRQIGVFAITAVLLQAKGQNTILTAVESPQGKLCLSCLKSHSVPDTVTCLSELFMGPFQMASAST